MDLRTRLEEMRRDAEERHHEIQDELVEMASREFIGEAEDGSVQVVVDGNGSVCDVRVDSKRLRTIKGDQLGQSVVEAVRMARLACQAGTSDILEHLNGGDAEALGHCAGQGPPGDPLRGWLR